MYIYHHKIVVDVISSEGSPDAIEKLIDGLSTSTHRFDARTDPENRRNGPSTQIANPPAYPTEPGMKALDEYAALKDAWLDTWPTSKDFER